MIFLSSIMSFRFSENLLKGIFSCAAKIGMQFFNATHHAPVMGAKEDIKRLLMPTNVSIHAPVMGANSDTDTGLRPLSFNPRTRDGCEQNGEMVGFATSVSIHAPVMGANQAVLCK